MSFWRIAALTFILCLMILIQPGTPVSLAAEPSTIGGPTSLAAGTSSGEPAPTLPAADTSPPLPPFLQSASPAPQEWVSEPPRHIIIRFERAIEQASSTLRVSTSTATEDVAGQISFPQENEIAFQFAEPPPEATYFVEWQTTFADDGTEVEGRYHFTYLIPDAWDEPLDRREVNRLLGNLVPSWLLLIPAVLGIGGLVWALLAVWRD